MFWKLHDQTSPPAYFQKFPSNSIKLEKDKKLIVLEPHLDGVEQ